MGVIGVFLTGRVQPGEWDAVSNTVKLDRDNDSVTDVTYYYGRSGELVSSKEDNNFDGAVDAWFSFDYGFVSAGKTDSNFNGKWDSFSKFKDGVLVQVDFMPDESDIVVRRYYYQDGVFYKELVDTDLDGEFDVENRFDPFGAKISSTELH